MAALVRVRVSTSTSSKALCEVVLGTSTEGPAPALRKSRLNRPAGEYGEETRARTWYRPVAGTCTE